MTRPLALVISWYGRDLKGGAEQLAYQVATRLARRGHRVEVLTTCCRSFLDDWTHNHHPAGVQEEDGVLVRRFRVDKRRSDQFVAANDFVLAVPKEQLLPGVSPFTCGTADVFVHENIRSKALLQHLRRHGHAYRAIVFLPCRKGGWMGRLYRANVAMEPHLAQASDLQFKPNARHCTWLDKNGRFRHVWHPGCVCCQAIAQ